MKNAYKITLCAMSAAISLVFLLAAYFPYLTFALPALAGAVMIVPMVEINRKYAFFTYLTVSIIAFLTAEKEAMLLYICFLGYYPVLKSVYEKINIKPIEYLLKFLNFNAAILIIYKVLAGIFGVDISSLKDFGKYTVPVLLVMANVVFFLYDTVLTKAGYFYCFKIRDKIRIMNNKRK